MNPMETIKSFLSGGANPQQVLMRMVASNNSNPMIANLVNMAQKGDKKGVENFARNIFKEQNRDFDKEYSEFMQNFKK